MGEVPGRDTGEGRIRQGVTCLIPVKGVEEGRTIWLEEPKHAVPLQECVGEALGLPQIKVVHERSPDGAAMAYFYLLLREQVLVGVGEQPGRV